MNGVNVFRLGSIEDLTYEVKELGYSFLNMQFFVDKMITKKSFWRDTLFLIGYSFLKSNEAERGFNLVRSIVEEHNAKFLLVHPNASAVGALDLGYESDSKTKTSFKKGTTVIYNLGCETVRSGKENFVIYQGSHGDKGARSADLILPSTCYLEEDAIFVNMEGRSQFARKAIQPPGHAKENWKIIRALSEKIGFVPPWLDLNSLRNELFKEIPHVSSPGKIVEVPWSLSKETTKLVSEEPLTDVSKSYYLSNIICRASKTMGDLARARISINKKKAS